MYANSEGPRLRGLGDADSDAALARLRAAPTVYTVAPFGRIVAAAGDSWFAPDYMGGSTIGADVMAGLGLPRAPSQQPPDVYRAPVAPRSLVQQVIYDVLMRNATWNAKLEPELLAELQRGAAAGMLSQADVALILSKKDDPAAAIAAGVWLPPGGGDVPKAIDPSYYSDTGQIHPDLLTPEQQARTAEVLAYTAKVKGTTFEEEAAAAANKIRTAVGDTTPGLEKFLGGMERGEIVNLSAQERYGEGAVSTEGGPVVASASVSKLAPLLAIAGMGLLFFLPKHRGGR